MSITYIREFFSQKNSRDKSVIKNISFGFIAKGLSILIGFLQIPLTLSILNKSEYGVWITIFSVTSWLSFFDIGMGNGLRNKLTAALAESDIVKARKIVSTAYFSLAAIFSAIILLFVFVSFFIPWTRVFQSPLELQSQLYWTILLAVISTSLNFVFGLIHIVMATFHRTGKSNMLLLISQGAILGILFFLSFYRINNAFLVVATILSVVPLLLNIGLNIYFFSGPYKHIAPSVKMYDKQYLRSLMSLGAMFFIIQIAAVIIYSTDNLIITQIYGPQDVVTYSLVYRYFSTVYIVFGIIITPLWTMYVDAYQKKDIQWLSKSIKNLVRLLYFFIANIVIMLIISPLFFRIWIGSSFNPPLGLCIAVSTYVVLLAWGNIWVLPLNAAGNIKIQMFVSLLQAFLNVPVILLINSFSHNLTSVVIGNIVCVLGGSSFMYYYYRKHFYHQYIIKE